MSNTTPVLQRTWQFNVNNVVTGSTTQPGGATDAPGFRRQLLIDIKEALKGFASNPWTVTLSNGYNAGAGAGDNIGTDIDELRWANSRSAQRSWFVMRNAVLGLEYCFDCYNSTNRDGAMADVFVAPVTDPFAGGSATARPTSASEQEILNGDNTGNFGSWGSGADNATSKAYILHVMHSSDGLATRVVVCLGGQAIGWWFFEQIEDEIGSHTYPWVFRVRAEALSDTADSMLYSSNCQGNRARGYDNGLGAINYYLATPCNDWQNTAIGNDTTLKNPYDGRFALPEVALASDSTGWIGMHGVMYDLWYGPGLGGAGHTGKVYPASSRDFIQFGNLVLPWDGSIPLVN